MVAGSVRTPLLLIAAWALLFAPGAAASDAAADESLLDSDQIAAAVIAPTFGPDGLIIGGSCRSDGDEVSGACFGESGSLPVAVIVVSVGLVVATYVARPDASPFRASHSLTPRAPPAG